jgi:hypothetical protein
MKIRLHPARRHTLPMATLGLVLVLVGSGCSLHAITGDVMAEYTTDHLIPHIMSQGDPTAACEAGVSMGGFLAAYGRVTDEPHAGLIPTITSAAVCAEEAAWSESLRSLRAIKRGDGAEAKDARVAEQRFRTVAARRYYETYTRTQALFGELGGACPTLENEYSELVFLLGMMGAVQGVAHDRAAAGRVGIPLDVPRRAERAFKCLNNERWWHVPAAFRAAIWTSVPGAVPEGVDPWAVLAEAAEKGATQGVRLAHAIYIQAAAGAGKDDLVRKAIAAQAASMANVPAAAKWKTLDAIAFRQSRFLSDGIWTRAEGHRTPHGRFGELPGGVAPTDSDDDDDDLLDGEDLGSAVGPPAPAVAQPSRL